MPDISMCDGGNCPLKEQCYRYPAKPNPQWQSYMKAPLDAARGDCPYFWPMEEKDV